MQVEKVEPCGRVVLITGRRGKAEFLPNVKQGDYIYYKINHQRIVCQITSMASLPTKGLFGTFDILNEVADIPKVWTNLYPFTNNIHGYINIGVTERGDPVSFRLNPFFQHVLVAGKTTKGKTHVQIVIHEELLKLHVPSIIIDTQGEFVHLNKFDANALVVEDMRFDDLLSHLKFKKTVVFNLQGLPNPSKTRRCYEILSQLYTAKEKDYKQAENDVRLLQIPPVIVDIDETEIYAPEWYGKTLDKDCRDCLCNIAKRGGKVGIGIIVNSQRLPGLHYDIRSQCNSALIFQITDSGSRTVLSQLPYISSLDLRRVKNLQRGSCIVTGEIVDHPIMVRVRDIEIPRAKNLNFEGMLGIKPLVIGQIEEDESLLTSLGGRSESISFEHLQSAFPTREVPIHGKCIIVPERHFKPEWKNTLEVQNCRVIYCPDMPGGSVYLVRKKSSKERQRSEPLGSSNEENEKILKQIRETAEIYLPRDTSKVPYKD